MEFDFWNQSRAHHQPNPDEFPAAASWPGESNIQEHDDEDDSTQWLRSSSNPFKRLRFEQPSCSSSSGTELFDLPASILAHILSLIPNTRTRNCASLVCREWLHLERASRRALRLRGSVHQLHMLPPSFHAVRHLDMSNLSPWGASPFHSLQPAVCSQLVAQWLSRAFPAVTHVTLYARHALDIHMAAATWPRLHAARLVRWHQRPEQHADDSEAEPGGELHHLLAACPDLTTLDLSAFYCWTEDVPPAFEEARGLGRNLVSLNILKLSPEGFRSGELERIAAGCGRLEELFALCEFDPRYPDCLGDECLALLAERLGGRLRVLHLVDSTQFGDLRQQEEITGDGESGLDSGLTIQGLKTVFRGLPRLEDLALLPGHSVRNSGPVFEEMARSCKVLSSIRIGHFQGVCPGPMLNGLAALGPVLRRLFLRSCDDLGDFHLCLVSMGCSRIEHLGLRSCGMITESGLRDSASILRWRLTNVEIESCRGLPTSGVLRALQPVRTNLRHLQLDCIWSPEEEEQLQISSSSSSSSSSDFIHSPLEEDWIKLESLSLWIPAVQVVSPIIKLGLASCPALTTLSIRVEGDCRLFQKPRAREFGLSSFAKFPELRNLKLDLSEAVGYALSAPGGNRDLSIWERFYLQGIQALKRVEALDYYPPSDKDVNYRGMTLPGVGLISLCQGLRRLFVHGSTYEHLFMMLLKIFGLRDCQLRADYFPTPEMETGTEMRPESCRRFEILLEKRGFPD